VWIRLYSLPQEFWLEEILQGIDNTLGIEVKSVEATRQIHYTSYVTIYVYKDISKPLPGSICLEHQDNDWIQTIDYEHIPFRCRKCHEHGHLFGDCSLNVPPKVEKMVAEKNKDGFTQVQGKQRQYPYKKIVNTQAKAPSTSNSFVILNQTLENQEMEGVCHDLPKVQEKETIHSIHPIIEKIVPVSGPNPVMEEKGTEDGGDIEIELDEKEIVRIDLVSLEEAYHKKGFLSLPLEQLPKVKKVYQDSTVGTTSRSVLGLGIQKNTLNDSQKQSREKKCVAENQPNS